MYNFVSGNKINNLFKSSKYYKTNLGRALSVKLNNKRVFSLDDEDIFIKFYLDKYKTVIYSQGIIGQINFLVDHYINNDIIIVFYKEKDFIFQHDQSLLNSVGIDSYIGSFIKEIETKYNSELENANDISIDVEEANVKNIFDNPGNVSYEDIKKYYKNKNNI